MIKVSSDAEENKKLNSIVNRASMIGAWTPFIPWAWFNMAKPLKLTPIAFNQLISGNRSIHSLLTPFILLMSLVSLTIFFMVRLNILRKEFAALYKEELKNFKQSPIKTLIVLTKTTFFVALYGGSAFLVSKFVLLR
jgi:hypothetical protein